MEALNVSGFHGRPKQGAGGDDVLRIGHAIQRHRGGTQHVPRKLMNALFEGMLLRRQGQAQVSVGCHGVPFFTISPPLVTRSFVMSQLARNYTVSSTEGTEIWMPGSRPA